MKEMESKTPPEVVVPAENVVAADPAQQKPPGFSKGVAIGVGIMLLLMVGVAGYYAGKAAKSGSTPTPTPTPTMTETSTPTPTATETVTPTVTATTTAAATPTPTVATVTKTARIQEFGGDYKLKFTLQVPADVTVTEGKVGSWNGIILKKGTKNFMAFNLPYELYELLTYTSKTAVTSTIPNLFRVRAKYVFSNSGSYSFAVTYASASAIYSGSDCTDSMGSSEKSKSPCVLPAAVYNSEIGFGAYCSVDSSYIAICDSVMKTIKVAKE